MIVTFITCPDYFLIPADFTPHGLSDFKQLKFVIQSAAKKLLLKYEINLIHSNLNLGKGACIQINHVTSTINVTKVDIVFTVAGICAAGAFSTPWSPDLLRLLPTPFVAVDLQGTKYLAANR